MKQRVYGRSGVKEYLIVQMYEQQIEWFALRERGYEALDPDENGRLRSELFSGLWLDTAAFWSGDLAQMLAALQEGLASPEHAAFARQLQVRPQE